MSQIVIVNKRKKHPDVTYDKIIYCGRGSALGNEFNFRAASQFETQSSHSRDDSCDKMRLTLVKYLLDSKNMFPKSQKVKDAFNDIYREYRKHDHVVALECYCLNLNHNVRDGQRCHTEDIKLIVERVAAYIDDNKSKHDALLELKSEFEASL